MVPEDESLIYFSPLVLKMNQTHEPHIITLKSILATFGSCCVLIGPPKSVCSYIWRLLNVGPGCSRQQRVGSVAMEAAGQVAAVSHEAPRLQLWEMKPVRVSQTALMLSPESLPIQMLTRKQKPAVFVCILNRCSGCKYGGGMPFVFILLHSGEGGGLCVERKQSFTCSQPQIQSVLFSERADLYLVNQIFVFWEWRANSGPALIQTRCMDVPISMPSYTPVQSASSLVVFHDLDVQLLFQKSRIYFHSAHLNQTN